MQDLCLWQGAVGLEAPSVDGRMSASFAERQKVKSVPRLPHMSGSALPVRDDGIRSAVRPSCPSRAEYGGVRFLSTRDGSSDMCVAMVRAFPGRYVPYIPRFVSRAEALGSKLRAAQPSLAKTVS